MKDRATIEDVARDAGVSRAAVSKVIRGAYGVSDSMRERVETVIETLGYRPLVSARGLRGATFTLGIELPDLSNQFFVKILAGATRALQTEPYQLIIAPADPDHHEGYRAVEALIDRQVDGLVVVSPLVEPQYLEELSRRTPVVMLGRHDPSRQYDTVVGDDLAGATLAMQHLLDLGHTDIAHVTHDSGITRAGSGTPHALRLDAYRASMRASGNEDSIRVVRTGFGEDAAFAATAEFLASGTPPTAIFAGHDELALGVSRAVAAAELGTTMSIVGYDNTSIAAHPLVGLTSVDQDGERMGRLVVSMLLERIAGRTETVHEVIAPTLVARSSTRAPTVT